MTPNVDEAATIAGLTVGDVERHAGCGLEAARNGGVRRRNHWRASGKSDRPVELSDEAWNRTGSIKAERQRSNSTHGTGCAFSTAIACHLAQDRGLAEATLLAKTYVTAAISNGYPLGKGTGPVNHLYRMNQQRRAAGSGGDSSESKHS